MKPWTRNPLRGLLAAALAGLLSLAAPAWSAEGEAPSPTASAPAAPASAASACPPVAAGFEQAEMVELARKARDRGFLWRLSKGGHSSWLYGTLHLAQRDWMFPGPQTLAALKESERLMLELDLLDPATVKRMQVAISNSPQALQLPAELKARMTQAAQAACVGTGLDGLRPEMQAVTLMLLAGRMEGLDPAYGIDGFLAGFGRGLRKVVGALETPEQQARLLLATDAKGQQDMVRQALDDLDSGKAQRGMRRLSGLWAQGDWDGLSRYPQWCECLDTPAERQQNARMLDQRNGPMARRIAALHEGGLQVFAAVGSLHMVGPQGLPALLAARGFQVERSVWPAPAERVCPEPLDSPPGRTISADCSPAPSTTNKE